jgi:uncharacterized protein (TIGR02145 family)
MKKTVLLLLLISGFTSQAQITDIDGNSYDTVRIGTQVWMAENLNVSRFRNGDTIMEAKTAEEWAKAIENQQPAWCYYDNNPENGDKYGKLYNWYTINDSRGLAPINYDIPTHIEWTVLVDYCGGFDVAGKKLKSKSGWGFLHNGSNKSGFSGLPGGLCRDDGTFGFKKMYGYFWTSSEYHTNFVWTREIDYSDRFVNGDPRPKVWGFSVRCIKD